MQQQTANDRGRALEMRARILSNCYLSVTYEVGF